jgi:hypothetical protein
VKFSVEKLSELLPWILATITFFELKLSVGVMFSNAIRETDIEPLKERLECENASGSSVVSSTPAS